MSSAISIRETHKCFGELHALKGVDLEIHQGEFFGLLGPNGAGKSTLINIIAGLTRADGGQVSVMGYDVVIDYRRSRRCLGIVPQELVFDPFFSVREVLRLQAGYFGLGAEVEPWINELLDALMLADKADANMRSLSGGMKRRVLVAQALVHKPEVVVLDEPTAGVDVELRQSLWQFIKRMHERGHTIVLTTHYLEEAESLCDRIAILNHGEIVALDTKEGLLKHGVGNRICMSVKVADAGWTLPQVLTNKLKERAGAQLVFQLDRSEDSIIDVLDTLRKGGAEVLELQTKTADLEDVFIELIANRKVKAS
ncbi:MAG: ABC transporter ATP-binding protein [Gammaproteobacteria bacterium]|nr:MAG: ABC transporter ATP-binding protein [Gammaproteobacteria bacterium]